MGPSPALDMMQGEIVVRVQQALLAEGEVLLLAERRLSCSTGYDADVLFARVGVVDGAGVVDVASP